MMMAVVVMVIMMLSLIIFISLTHFLIAHDFSFAMLFFFFLEYGCQSKKVPLK